MVGLANHTILLARDGREIPIDDCAAPIKGAAGQVHGAVLVFRDVTEVRIPLRPICTSPPWCKRPTTPSSAKICTAPFLAGTRGRNAYMAIPRQKLWASRLR